MTAEQQKAELKKKLYASIRRRERAFKKMTKAQQRVVVAKDVIELIESAKLRPAHDGYLKGVFANEVEIKALEKYYGDIDDKDADARDIYVSAGAPQCTACALGCLLIATMLRMDDVSATQLAEDGGNYLDGDKIAEYLSRLFPKRDLWLIEKAFEGSGVSGIAEPVEGTLEGTDLMYRAAEMVDRAKYGPRDAVIEIMKNIIKNKGRLRVPSKKELAKENPYGLLGYHDND